MGQQDTEVGGASSGPRTMPGRAVARRALHGAVEGEGGGEEGCGGRRHKEDEGWRREGASRHVLTLAVGVSDGRYLAYEEYDSESALVGRDVLGQHSYQVHTVPFAPWAPLAHENVPLSCNST